MDRGKITILACDSGKPFAEKIIRHLNKLENNNLQSINVTEKHFSNSEIKTEISESVRGTDVYIIQGFENSVTNRSVDEDLRALKATIDAAYRADASYVTAVVPVFPYARQEKSLSREGITAAMVAREIEDCGAYRVITLDIHAEANAGFFRKARFENLKASNMIIPYIKENIGLDNLVISSADTGGASRANYYANNLGVNRNIVFKVKDYKKAAGEQVEKVELLGEVNNKKVFVIDDMIDTGSTARPVIELLRNRGATEVYFGCSLPLFNGPAKERLSQLYKEGLLTKVIGTDAVYHGGEKFLQENPWYNEVSVAGHFAQVIHNINKKESITKLL
ncbi:MAG: ribose-phosphate pyrophosphokinase [Candidatus Nanoarchaeia archaeon]